MHVCFFSLINAKQWIHIFLSIIIDQLVCNEFLNNPIVTDFDSTCAISPDIFR